MGLHHRIRCAATEGPHAAVEGALVVVPPLLDVDSSSRVGIEVGAGAWSSAETVLVAKDTSRSKGPVEAAAILSLFPRIAGIGLAPVAAHCLPELRIGAQNATPSTVAPPRLSEACRYTSQHACPWTRR